MRMMLVAAIFLLTALPTLAKWESAITKDRMSGAETRNISNRSVGEGIKYVFFAKGGGLRDLRLLVVAQRSTDCNKDAPCNLRVKFGDDPPRKMVFRSTAYETVAVFGADAEKIRAALVAGKTVLIEVPFPNVGSAIAELRPTGFDPSFLDKK